MAVAGYPPYTYTHMRNPDLERTTNTVRTHPDSKSATSLRGWSGARAVSYMSIQKERGKRNVRVNRFDLLGETLR
jgi:hypothetical protein